MRAPGRRFAGYACALAICAIRQAALADDSTTQVPPPLVRQQPDVPGQDALRKIQPLVTPPLARAAVRAALTAARHGEVWARLSSLQARARNAAILPDLSVRVARNTDASLRMSPTTDEPYHYSSAGGVGWWIEGRLTWHFDRLMFDGQELAVERLRLEHAERTGKLVAKVLATLFAWQRAALRLDEPKAAPEERERAEVDRLEAEITLDQLTGGWFGAELARRRATE